MELYSSDDTKRERKKNGKDPIEEQTDHFLDIAEKLMNMTLRISDLVERSMRNIEARVSNVQHQINGLEARIRNADGKNEEDK